MDKLSFTQEGVSRLPPGFRFQPTDEELVFQYLKCKVFSCPLPAQVIPEINVCNFDPWDLLPGATDCIFPQINNSIQNSLAQMENWVLCRLFLKKGDVKDNDMLIQTSTNNKVVNVGVAQPRFFDFMMGYKTSLPLASSTSSSSGSNTSTEVSSSGADYEESSACTHY
ncbi:NAC domain-containing protein 83-like [Fagus crenata]